MGSAFRVRVKGYSDLEAESEFLILALSEDSSLEWVPQPITTGTVRGLRS